MPGSNDQEGNEGSTSSAFGVYNIDHLSAKPGMYTESRCGMTI